MLKSFVVAFALIFIPSSALAVTAADSASSSLLGQQATNGLGPAANTDSSTLQSTGTSPLQSSNQSNSSLGSQGSDALQAPPTSDELKVIIYGDADGGPNELDANTNTTELIALGISIAIIFGLAGFLIYSRRKERRHLAQNR